MNDLAEVNLRSGQGKVAQYREGKLAVPAVPGAGKTFTLAYLAADLIAHNQVQSGKILIVTYMNSAVSNFKSRIDDFLEARGLTPRQGYEVKTLHSLAMSILKERPDYLLINEEFQVVDEGRQWDLIEGLAQEWLRKNKNKWQKIIDCRRNTKWFSIAADIWQDKDFIKFIKSMIKHFKMKGLTREQAAKLQQQVDSDSYLAWALEIFVEYNLELSRNGWLDFNDLIINAWKLLEEDEELCQRLQEKWSYVFEDEAQDSNPVQERVLYLLAGENGNLVRVGDSNQSIMGTFTSADPENFRSFCDRVKQQSILYSSRSAQPIIDLANYLVEWSRNSHPEQPCQDALALQKIKPVSQDDSHPNPQVEGYPIFTEEFATQEEEITAIAKEAKEYINDHPEETVAIIAPSGYYCSDMLDVLRDLEVPCQGVGGINQAYQETIESLKLAIKYLAQPHQTERLIDLLNNYFLVEFSSVEQKLVAQLLTDRSLQEILYHPSGELPIVEFPDELAGSKKLLTVFREVVEKVQHWLKASLSLPPDELVLFLAEELGLEEDALALAQGMALQIKDHLQNHPSWKLADVVENLDDLNQSFETVAKKLDGVRGFEAKPGVVTVLTAHKSKGLEWDAVFITAIVAESYPATLSDSFKGESWYLDDDKSNPVALAQAQLARELEGDVVIDPVLESKIEVIKERLRLLYVAITRAKRSLFLSGYRERKKRNGDLKEVGVSRTFKVLSRYIKSEGRSQ
ncbi:ATP-dependent helicase [Halanaerocella petrolearia]